MVIRGQRSRWSRLLPWFAPLCALAVALLALPSAPGPSQNLAFAAAPQVLDPQPAPGALVSAGPVVLGARVENADGERITFLIDGEDARGPATDPDGDLSDLLGVEVTLGPGTHRIGVRVGDHGVLRQWDVAVSGLGIDTMNDDLDALIERFDTHDSTPGPSIVLNTDSPEAVAVLPTLLRRTGGTLVPMAGIRLSFSAWATLRTTDAPVLLLGDESVISPEIEEQITRVGLNSTRLDGRTASEVSISVLRYLGAADDGGRGLLVAPAEPLADALTAAISAADLGTDLLLLGRTMPSAARRTVADSDTVLLASNLSRGQRRLVEGALDDAADVSERSLEPGPAQEALIVADVTDRPRAIVTAALSTPERPVLLTSAAAAAWVGSTRPDRVTVIAPLLGDADEGTDTLDLPTIATATAVDGAARAVVIPRPLAVPSAHGGVAAPDPEDVIQGALQVADLRDQVRRAVVDGIDAPSVEALLDTTRDAPMITVSSPASISDATIHVQILAYEWPGTVSVTDGVATWTAGPRPALPAALERNDARRPTPIQITTQVTAAGAIAHQAFDSIVGLDPLDGISSEGWVVAGGVDQRVGMQGRLYTYSVEVEPETGLDISEVQDEVSRVLSDERSWTADGAVSFRRVGPTERARIRVVVARPATVDEFCGRVGLSTGGRVSCWDGYRAMLNLDRWNVGVAPFHDDLAVYRQYLINHEVGHGLGHGHEYCTRRGTPAPVMMQQTGGIGACLANGWPFP